MSKKYSKTIVKFEDDFGIDQLDLNDINTARRKMIVIPKTKISDLMCISQVSNELMFMDCGNNSVNLMLTMVDFIKNDQTYGVATDCRCWWDRNQFETAPLGVPITYYPKKSRMSSELDKIDHYDEYFEVEGVFCSFPCCMAYIKDNLKTVRYKNSHTLLKMMYRKLHQNIDTKHIHIPTASNWRILNEYGGCKTISEFRSVFSSFSYVMTNNIRKPIMRPVGNYLEKKTNSSKYPKTIDFMVPL